MIDWVRLRRGAGRKPTRPGADVLFTSCADGPGSPRGFYLRHGFADTGRIMWGENVLGLEVVLPDGRIWDGLHGLRKNNTGFDLKHVFIGSEGTLGIITGATLKLHPLPSAHATAWLALTGWMIDAETAQRWGLVDEIILI